MRLLPVALLLAFAQTGVAAQGDARTSAGERFLRLGLLGFGAHLGVDLEDDNQLLAALAADFGDVYGSRLRLRPLAEIGFTPGENTYVVGADVLVRFADDARTAVPYVGGGLGVYGQEGCDAAADCPAVWLQFTMGVEVRIRRGFAWLVEYRGEDAFSRHRLYVGLATRRVS